METIVVGAGLAGLTAALHLAERGVPVWLLEADALYPGGRLWGGPTRAPGADPADNAVRLTLRGVTHTFYPEHGMHGLWNPYHNLHAVLERFNIAPPLMLSQEQDWLHLEAGRVLRTEVGSAITGGPLPAPLHYLELFTRPSFLAVLGPRDWVALFSVWRSLLLALALDPFERALPLEGQTLDDFLQGWSPRLRAMFLSLAASGLASPPEKISLAAFIACLRFYSLLRRDALRFAFFHSDAGTALIEPLVARLRERESELVLGALVDRLEPLAGGGWRVRAQTRSGPRTFLGAHVVLALDPPAAQRLLSESPATQAEAQRCTWPEGLLNGTVRLWFDAQPRPGAEGGIFSGDFSVDNFFWLHQIQPEIAAWARATGGSLLEMHLYRTAPFFAQPDGVILARAANDACQAWPELRGHLVHQALQRNAAAQTRITVDRPERWLGVRSPWAGMWLCGDWVRGPWPALFIERACVSGVEAANGILSGLGLEPFPVRPYGPPDGLAAWLQAAMLAGRAWLRRRRGQT